MENVREMGVRLVRSSYCRFCDRTFRYCYLNVDYHFIHFAVIFLRLT